MDTAGPSSGLHTAAVCCSGLEMLWRKATEKVKGRQALQTYLGGLRISYFEEATLGRCTLRWRNIFLQREYQENREGWMMIDEI